MKAPFFYMLVWIAIASSAFIGYGFWYSVIANKSSTVADLQRQIDSKLESVDRIASTRIALAEISSYESVVQSYFVPETEVVSFINGLEDRGRALNSTVKVLSVSTDEKEESRSTLVLALLIKGTFDSVMRTVGVIEYAPYNLYISKLTLGKDEKNLWSADMEIVVGSVRNHP